MKCYAMSQLVATATATARQLHYYVVKYRTSLALPLATVIAEAIADRYWIGFTFHTRTTKCTQILEHFKGHQGNGRLPLLPLGA